MNARSQVLVLRKFILSGACRNRGWKKFSRKIFLGHGFFTGVAAGKAVCFQHLMFGVRLALRKCEEGRRAEDPFRGLRAGPARSSLSPASAAYPKHHTQGPYPTAEVRLDAPLNLEFKRINTKDTARPRRSPGHRRFVQIPVSSGVSEFGMIRGVVVHGAPGKIGWGERTRTSTIRINSAVSYRLDHAPTKVEFAILPYVTRAG